MPLKFLSNSQKQPNPQQLPWSSYKNHNTLKTLVGITPSAVTSFVSGLFSWLISNRELTIQSRILQKEWDRYFLVMADWGFYTWKIVQLIIYFLFVVCSQTFMTLFIEWMVFLRVMQIKAVLNMLQYLLKEANEQTVNFTNRKAAKILQQLQRC